MDELGATIDGMKRTELFDAMLPAPPWSKSGKPYRARWQMTREDAERRGGTVIESTMRVIMVPETPEEEAENSRQMSTSGWQRNVDKPQ